MAAINPLEERMDFHAMFNEKLTYKVKPSIEKAKRFHDEGKMKLVRSVRRSAV